MEKQGKRRLLFDLTEEEYEDFIEGAKELGLSNKNFFRKVFSTYQQTPPFMDQRVNTPLASLRHTYIRIAVSILGLMTGINNNERADETLSCVLDREWELHLLQINDIMEFLKAVPPTTPHENCEYPEPPGWLGNIYKRIINSTKTK